MRLFSVACIICILLYTLGAKSSSEQNEVSGKKSSSLRTIVLPEKSQDSFHVLDSRFDFLLQSVKGLLFDHRSEFFLRDTNQSVYYDANEKNWYVQQHEGLRETLADIRIPLTWCYDTINGGGGAINQAFEILLSALQVFPNEVKLEGIMQIRGTVLLGSLGASLSESVTYKGAHSCNIQKGQYARMYLRPQYHEVPEGKRMPIRFHVAQGFEEIGDWERTPSFKRFSAHLPLLECALGPDPEICDMGLL